MTRTAVDRTYPLASDEFAMRNPDRIRVVRWESTDPSRLDYGHCPWWVWRGVNLLATSPTHAEAIRWAQWFAVLDRYPRRHSWLTF
jgi:hypothetical protein